MSAVTFISTIRHAHTQYNAERRYTGTIDISLSDKGIREAKLAAARLKGTKFDVVITSRYKRALETAKILVDNTTAIVQSELCGERNFGIMEGLTWVDIQSLQPPVMVIQVGNDIHTVNPKGGEPFEKIWERANRFHRYIFKKYSGSTVLVVSHGVFLQMFHGVLRGLSCIESLALYPSNLELVRFRFSGRKLMEEKVFKLADTEVFHW